MRFLCKQKGAATYSPALHCSTIGASGLNFSVRDGKRWDPAAITTRYGGHVARSEKVFNKDIQKGHVNVNVNVIVNENTHAREHAYS